MNIVILDGYTENPGDLSWSGFAELGTLKVYDRTQNDTQQIIERIGEANIVFTNKTPLNEAVFSACKNIRFVGTLSTGYNVVDVDSAKKYGIVVSNVPSYSTDSVAQFTIGLLLEICNGIGHHNQAVHDGKWQNSIDFCFWDFPLIELAGKTFGIIGYGRIGQAVAKLARAFGMKTLAYNKRPKTEGSEFAEYVPLEMIFAQSDVISLHCPLFAETQEIINKNSIKKMKNGVILLNTSRGQLINEQDLADALNSNKIYAAAVDVVSAEPIKKENPLLKAKNCIITPHIAWAPKESRQRLMDIAVGNLKAFIDGNPKNVVNGT